MKRVLLDVNVVLDVLLDHAPFAGASSAVWAAVEQGEAEGLLSAKAVGVRQARDTTDASLSVFRAVPGSRCPRPDRRW